MENLNVYNNIVLVYFNNWEDLVTFCSCSIYSNC